jgi:cysteinyl-tRNA synthetase
MPASLVAAITSALDDALDSPAAVAGLRELADSDTDDTGDVPPGARFEAFAHVDQFVGLDLARQVGQL